jgi:hypothetical protein
MEGRLRRALSALGFLIAACTPAAGNDAPGWAQFEAPQRVTVTGYDGDAMEPFLSRDGRVLLFNNRNHPPERTDIHWASRVDDLTFRYRGLVEGVNSPALDGVPTMAADGRFCFISTRAYFAELATVYCGAWLEGAAVNVTLQPDAGGRVRGRLAFDVEIDARGELLVFADGLFRGGPAPVAADLRVARRDGDQFRLSPGDDALLRAINTNGLEYAAALSADSRELAFTRLTGRPPFARIGIWIARRPDGAAPFGAPTRIAAITGFVEAPTFAPDGAALYFHKREGDRFTLWRAARR